MAHLVDVQRQLDVRKSAVVRGQIAQHEAAQHCGAVGPHLTDVLRLVLAKCTMMKSGDQRHVKRSIEGE
jgi:hypothetical protein